MKMYRQTAIFSITLFAVFPQIGTGQGIQGEVLSDSGQPIAGAAVWNMPVDKAVTDAEGMFSLKPGGTLRISAAGYRPTSRVVQDGSKPVIITLQQSSADAVWRPPTCKLTKEWFRGEHMGFLLPKRASIKRGFDVDYGYTFVRFKKNALRFGWGGTWSFGYSGAKEFFSDPSISELQERDIAGPFEDNPEIVPTAEYRGKRRDGTYFRWLGKFGETIEYDHATEEAAKYFDQILDSMCWVLARDSIRYNQK